jgi:cytochrome c-type biogenesis protein
LTAPRGNPRDARALPETSGVLVDVTLGAALLAGLLSFLSPCVLPVVPAYLGQLGIVASRPVSTEAQLLAPASALAGSGSGGGGNQATFTLGTSPTVAAGASGWRAMPNAFAFVFGFTLVFTLVGVLVYQAASPLREHLPLLREIGGVILVLLGLNLMGVLRARTLARSWKPLERFGSDRPRRGGVVGGFVLGSVFAVGWTPCIGPVLGSILMMAAVGASPQVVALLVAYSLGLGIPFILVALAVDRAPLVTRPILRYSRYIEIAGGLLVIVLGLALIFDWLGWIAARFAWLDFGTTLQIPF